MEQTTLYYRNGGSDKVYTVTLEPRKDGYIINTQFGRRGSTQQTGTKTPVAVNLDAARAIYEKLIKEKMTKGYTPGEAGVPYSHSDHERQVTNIQCQLLNPIDGDEIGKLILHPEWWMQEKLDGQRRLIQKIGNEVIGINRRGLRVDLPQPLIEESQRYSGDFLIDGEAIGEHFHAFDILMFRGQDLMSRPYLERYLSLMHLFTSWEGQHIQIVLTACTADEKQRRFDVLKTRNAEGVAFKHIIEPYTSGRPASGGSALKYKFHDTASFVVQRINTKRSVSLMLFNGDKVQPAGNVTIPANQEIPAVGSVVEVQYLYAFQQSGCIYQPVYLGVREDITSEECSVDQLKYKAQIPEAATAV